VYLTQDEAAALLRRSPRSLERHRLAGTGPAFIRAGRRVIYNRRVIEAWTEANTFTSTSDTAKQKVRHAR
jgi:hypothetical protein